MERPGSGRLITWSSFVIVTGRGGEYTEAGWWRAKASSPEAFKAFVRRSLQDRFSEDVELSFGPLTGSSRGPWEL